MITVLEPGIESRLVDFGRPRSRSLGVPIGGAADRRSLALGNALVGNPPDAVALEIALAGPRLRADAKVACVLFGAPFAMASSGGGATIEVPPEVGHTFTLGAGQTLHLRAARAGVRAYFCVRGGFHAPRILASRSALEPLRKGDVLECAVSAIHLRFCSELRPNLPSQGELAVLPGAQVSWFDEGEFFAQTFRVAPASNRMGLRLQGNPLTMRGREMVSEPVCPGAIQVTPDGQCIVLGVDGQTIGGYPKIGHVIQADLDALGQLRPGQSVTFRKISLQDAHERYHQEQADLRRWALRLQLALDAFPNR